MKDVKDIVCYADRKLYDFDEVIGNFDKYYGLSIEEISNLFSFCSIMEWDEIYDKLEDIGFTNNDIMSRYFTYEFYNKTFLNLKIKGLELVDLVKYLYNLKVVDYDVFYENKLHVCDISHFGSLLIGKDINRILIVMYHLLKRFYEVIEKINLIDTYIDNKNLVCKSAIVIDGDNAYPSDSLIVYDDEDKDLLDKTSFIVRANGSKKKTRVKMSN